MNNTPEQLKAMSDGEIDVLCAEAQGWCFSLGGNLKEELDNFEGDDN